MTTYISMLRAINVLGKNKIKMSELEALYHALGCDKVKTYIQSGNVVFEATDDLTKAGISESLRQAIHDKFGYTVPVIIRTLEELESIVKSNPFLDRASANTQKLYVTFLAGDPLAEDTEKLRSFKYYPDRFELIGSEIYLECAGGYGTTKLSNTFFENKLRIPATTRNWNTICKLLNLAKDTGK